MGNIIDTLKISLKDIDTKIPMRSTVGSAGYDIFSHRKMVIPAKQIVSIKLPFEFIGTLDEKLEIRVFVRSSFGIKKLFRLAYKDDKNIEYLVLNLNDKNHIINVINDSDKDLIIEKGEHFAQFVICEKPYNFEKMNLENVPEQEMKKHKILKGKIIEKQQNLYEFILNEDLTFNSNEQKTFATGLRSLISDNTWTAITAHKDVKDKVMLANQTAVIDKDYAFTDNYGHCFVGLVNLLDEETTILKGTKLMSWWTEKYYILKDEIKNNKKRSGGIGSTSK